jgi:hypothetical protein
MRLERFITGTVAPRGAASIARPWAERARPGRLVEHRHRRAALHRDRRGDVRHQDGLVRRRGPPQRLAEDLVRPLHRPGTEAGGRDALDPHVARPHHLAEREAPCGDDHRHRLHDAPGERERCVGIPSARMVSVAVKRPPAASIAACSTAMRGCPPVGTMGGTKPGSSTSVPWSRRSASRSRSVTSTSGRERPGRSMTTRSAPPTGRQAMPFDSAMA